MELLKGITIAACIGFLVGLFIHVILPKLIQYRSNKNFIKKNKR